MALDNVENIQSWLEALRAKHAVVGASIAVLHQGQVHLAAAGLLNVNTGVDVTTDALFQIGSISKVFTATLIMQLVDEGRVQLDHSIKQYLPSFESADHMASQAITVRQLLCHTSGLDGDFFPEDSPFGPSISGFVEQCRLLPQLHPVGEYFSYCNSGYTVAGRIVEVLTGKPWAQAVNDRILRPLGMRQSVVDPADVLRFRAAIGHVPDEQIPVVPRVASQCYLPLSHAPAGSVLTMSASDLLAFGQWHMNNGVNYEGEQRLSTTSVEQMQQAQVPLPDHFPMAITDWGLGWYLRNQSGQRMFGHNGGTVGQYAYLHVLPEQGFAVALLTNSSSGEFFEQVERELLATLPGVQCGGQVLESYDAPGDYQYYTGRYENIAGVLTVSVQAGELVAEFVTSLGATLKETLRMLDKHSFVTMPADGGVGQSLTFFISEPIGVSEYALVGSRLLRRIVALD